MNQSFDNFGSFLQAVAHAADRPNSTEHQRLLEINRRGYPGPAGASEQVPGDGGFAVPAEFMPTLIQRLYMSGEILSRCMELPMKSNSLAYPQFFETSRATGSRMGGVQAYFVNEGDTFTPTKPKFQRSELTAKKLIGLVFLTDELLQDAAALDIFDTAAFSKEMAFVLEDAIVNGLGSGLPQGILGSNALIEVAKQAGQSAGTILTANVCDMFARMWSPSRKTAIWLAHPAAEELLLTLSISVGTGGSEIPLYHSSKEIGQPWAMMLGAPVIPCEQCQVPGTPGDLIFADFSRYVIGMRERMATAVSLDVRFLTDEAVFRFTMRVDGQPIDAIPVIPFNGTVTTSPFTCIAQR